ncbi:oxidoreductase molybdopterin binding domain-containing protein [Colletotrichum truncatum]|uniref:Oxidoreductase molybdopterin binding domain-containing protein n=1 Tax=Colletotrichum truncatum TaxID=5467 RepID=A0ACC3Z3S1_COLTU|nr:oxidoreductase molybdopterin binding domain-containing protein [Colletotrichum truncatum]KAF6795606.1 oxidoreductase molybdopterin binding domain-containing protein [Colletotrichum truncatum]
MSKRAVTSWLRSFGTVAGGSAKRVSSGTRHVLQQSYTKQWTRLASNTARRPRPILLTAGAGALSTVLLLGLCPTPREGRETTGQLEASSSAPPSWPRYRLSEIKQHGADSERPWVTYAGSVYDVTDWVAAHPGGEVLLRAAGGAVEPYWDIFSIHKQHLEDVLAILEGYKVGEVGEVDEVDRHHLSGGVVDDPFQDDPIRDPRLRTLTERPRNAETPVEGLTDFITPTELFYVRNHMWVPAVEEAAAAEHIVIFETLDGEERAYTLQELRERFPIHKVSATLQCAGNRRKDMTERAGKTNGLQWTAGAVSTAEWEGVLLRDVIADVTGSHNAVADGRLTGVKHVHFVGLEAYAASIPISKALDPSGDVLLAFGMNGEPLTRDHGFPVRAVVPGNVAARSVKWLRRVTLSDEESSSQWQQRDYKTFCPSAGPDPDWSSAPAIQEMPVTSAIRAVKMEEPSQGSGEGKTIRAEGYAYSGGGREIVRVDVSTDGGRTWRPANLIDDAASGKKAWCWKRWRYEGLVTDDRDEGAQREDERVIDFVVKATDEAYNTQPESYESIYNVRGNLATAWHRIEIGRSERVSD